MKPKYTAVGALVIAASLMVVSAWWTFQQLQTTGEPITPATPAQIPQHAQPPKHAPDFTFIDLRGRSHRLSDWGKRGDYVLINFWATWCSPCRKELPLLLKLQKRYRARGLQIIGPAIDKPAAVVRYVKENAIKYPIFADRSRVTALSTRFGDTVNALPYSVLIAPDGRIVAAHAGRLHGALARAWLAPLATR